MKLKKGMYVRFEGKINKISAIEDNYVVFDDAWTDHWKYIICSMDIDRFINDYEPETSFNIIDLLEPGDYINGERIDFIVKPDMLGDEELNEGKIHLVGHEKYNFVYIKDIETIVTKERFENNTYMIQKEKIK